MEIFAQWLDDLDDLVFALALVWEKARVFCLRLGLLAALLLVNAVLASMPVAMAVALAYVSAASVLLWVCGSFGARLYARREQFRRA